MSNIHDEYSILYDEATKYQVLEEMADDSTYKDAFVKKGILKDGKLNDELINTQKVIEMATNNFWSDSDTAYRLQRCMEAAIADYVATL